MAAVVVGLFGASALTAVVIGLAGALLAWFAATIVLPTVTFVVAAVGGGVIGGKIYGQFQGAEGNVVTAVLVCATAGIAGGLSSRWSSSALRVVCALGGAAVVLNALAGPFPTSSRPCASP